MQQFRFVALRGNHAMEWIYAIPAYEWGGFDLIAATYISDDCFRSSSVEKSI